MRYVDDFLLITRNPDVAKTFLRTMTTGQREQAARGGTEHAAVHYHMCGYSYDLIPRTEPKRKSLKMSGRSGDEAVKQCTV